MSHQCENPWCDATVEGRRLCCSPECDRARRKALDASRPTPPNAPRVDPEEVLQKAAERLLRQLVRDGKILCWYHRPRLLGRASRPEQRGFPDLVIGVRATVIRAIELKQIGKDLEDDQKIWRLAFPYCALCRTMPEVLDALRGWGVQC